MQIECRIESQSPLHAQRGATVSRRSAAANGVLPHAAQLRCTASCTARAPGADGACKSAAAGRVASRAGAQTVCCQISCGHGCASQQQQERRECKSAESGARRFGSLRLRANCNSENISYRKNQGKSVNWHSKTEFFSGLQAHVSGALRFRPPVHMRLAVTWQGSCPPRGGSISRSGMLSSLGTTTCKRVLGHL